jgi:hypothetical protein
MEKKKISPVVIVSLLIVGLSLLTASILLYSERMSREAEDDNSSVTPINETSTPTQLDGGIVDPEAPVQVEGLSEDSTIETTPVSGPDGQVDVDAQIRAIEQELNAIDEDLYDENDISDSSLDL